MARARSVSDRQAATALVEVLGDSNWEAVALARAYLAATVDGADDETAARIAYEGGVATLRSSRDFVARSRSQGFLGQLKPREKTGSAENPVTKLFPATITEQRFLEVIDRLCDERPGLTYSDDRESGHTLSDVTFREGGHELPINIKNAGTRFEKAAELVGLDPNDSIPIPAYKAYGAVDSVPSLLYAVSVDYTLIPALQTLLPSLFDQAERTAWDLLGKFAGARVRSAEDAFVFRIVRRHWQRIRDSVTNAPFHVVSARKAIRILQTQPKRTPGVGLKAWGTGANAEVNVHLSIKEDMKTWDYVGERIKGSGIVDVITAVNRKRQELVYDPEI